MHYLYIWPTLNKHHFQCFSKEVIIEEYFLAAMNNSYRKFFLKKMIKIRKTFNLK